MTHFSPVTGAVLCRLRELLPSERIVTDPAQLCNYAHDESPEQHHLPEVVVKPVSTEEVASVVALAAAERLPITPRGLGTGLAGGSIPVAGGILISTELMNRILELDCDNLMVRTQPGVRTAQLQQTCADAGLYYPVDPASLEDCSIGGNVATNAGGARAFKYGVTGDYLRGIEAVLADGSVIRYGGKLIKNVTGYDLNRLLVGSEGTFGIITEMTFRLVPKPKYQIDLLVPCGAIRQGVELVLWLLRDDRILPSVVEFIEHQGIAACNQVLEYPLPFSDAAVQVLVELEGTDRQAVLEDSIRLGEQAMKLGAREPVVAENPTDQNRLWTARRSLAKTLKKVYHEVIAEDIVVPLAELPATIDFIAQLQQKYRTPVVPFGHIGDGNIHVDVCRVTSDRARWQQMSLKLIDELTDFVLSRGGQITAEHGVGTAKRWLMKKAVGSAELQLMRRLKQAVDPLGIMNPGKVLP